MSQDANEALAPYVNDIRRFMDAMMYKLRCNAHKGRWENISIKDALKLLKGEVVELEEALAEGNTVEVMLESADVANFAMIIASKIIEEGTTSHANRSGRSSKRHQALANRSHHTKTKRS